MKTVEERFWEKVDKNGPIIPYVGTPCWVWTAGTASYGYGHFRIGSKLIYTHRYSWELVNGAVPDGLMVCHKCDNSPCVNPNHLFLGTNSDNQRDSIEKGRGNKAIGDKNGSRVHPEKLARGDKNGSHTHPEKLARGDKNGAHTHPEKNGMRNHPEKASARKIDREIAEKIRTMYKTGDYMQKDLGAIFGLYFGNIGKIVRGEIWK
jgi:hypothetical protein